MLVGLRDATTAAPVATVDRSATIGALSDSAQQPNGEGASITAWGVAAPSQYDIVVSGVDGYLKSSYGGGVTRVLIEPARPTVPPPISLWACPLKVVCRY